MKLSKLPHKYILYVILLIIIIVIFFMSTAILIPTMLNIGSLRANLNEKEEQLAKLRKKRSLLESLDSQQMLSNLSEAELALPGEKNIGTIFLTLENLSTLTQQNISNINVTPGVIASGSAKSEDVLSELDVISQKGAQALRVSVDTNGTADQFKDFLRQLINSRRIMDIESVEISYLSETQDYLDATFSLLVYYLPTITQIGSLESQIIEFTQEEQQLLSNLIQLPDLSSVSVASESASLEPIGKTNLFEF